LPNPINDLTRLSACCSQQPPIFLAARPSAVRIEFEYESRSFKLHRHDPKACDLIVCWEHNRPQCVIEVLEIKTQVAKAVHLCLI
jgi:hypothetical protein